MLKHLKQPRNISRLSVYGLVCLLFAGLVCLVLPTPVNSSISGTACPASGNWTIASNTSVIDEPNLIVNGSIYIDNQMQFYVKNSTITINGGLGTNTWKNINFTAVDSTFIMNSTGLDFATGAGCYYINFQNVRVLNATGTTIGAVMLRAEAGLQVNNLYVDGYCSFTVRGYGNITNSFFNQSIHDGFIQGYAGSNIRSDNITVNMYQNASGFKFGGSNMAASNITVINPIGVETAVTMGYGTANNTINTLYVNGTGMLNPHMGVTWGTGGSICYNNNLSNAVISGRMGNGLFYSGTTGPCYADNVTVIGVYDGTDGTVPPTNSTCIISVFGSSFLNSVDNGLTGDNAGGGAWNFIDCYVNGSDAGSAMNVIGDNSFISTTNCTFNQQYRSGGFFCNAGNSSFISQNWNLSDGTTISVRTNSTANLNAHLFGVSESDGVLSYVLDGSSPSMTATIYSPNGEPYTVSGASYSYNAASQTLTVASSAGASVEIDFNIPTPLEKAKVDVSTNIYLAIGLAGVLPWIVLLAAILKGGLLNSDPSTLALAVVVVIVIDLALVVGLIVVAQTFLSIG